MAFNFEALLPLILEKSWLRDMELLVSKGQSLEKVKQSLLLLFSKGSKFGFGVGLFFSEIIGLITLENAMGAFDLEIVGEVFETLDEFKESCSESFDSSLRMYPALAISSQFTIVITWQYFKY